MVREIEAQLGQVTLVEIDHEIISKAVFPLLLIQDKQLSITDECMCTSTV